MKVNEIEPRFEAIESRLIAIESEVGEVRCATDNEPIGRASRKPRHASPTSANEQNPRPSAGEASEDATFPTAQKADIP
ncbi:MAG: hypothetical protein OXL96_28650, partial [Candidatus Poribacteria bacterium]|nr:hypothetical protein [Candidatus Poribacteria bacterium]